MRVIFGSPGFTLNRSRRQPWAYVYQVAKGLANRGLDLTVVTDSRSPTEGHADPPFRLQTSPHVSPPSRLFRSLPGSAFRGGDRLDVVVSFLAWQDIPTYFRSRTPPIQVAALTSPLFNNGEWRNLLQSGDSPLGGFYLLLSHLAAQSIRQEHFAPFDGVVAPSAPVHAHISSRLNGKPLLLAPSGVEEDVFRFAENGPAKTLERDPLITYCGPPRQSRGLRVLLKALAIVQRHRSDAEAQFLLRPDSRRDERNVRWLAGRLSRLPFPQRVSVEAAPLVRHEFLKRLSRSSICVFPFQYPVSLTPLSLLETVALGVQAVVTPVGDLPDLVRDFGGTVAEGTDVPEVAEALLRALDRGGPEAHQTRAGGPPTWDVAVEHWADFLDSLVAA